MSKVFTSDPIDSMQIAEWKDKHTRGIFAIEVNADDDTGNKVTGYFRKPTITELGMIGPKRDNPIAAAETLYNTCLLGGHPDFDTNEDVKLAALSKLGDIMKVREAELKKL